MWRWRNVACKKLELIEALAVLAKGLPEEAAFKNQRLCLPLKSLQGRSTAQITITGTSDTMLSFGLFVRRSDD